jgi:hypothetical protein
MAESGHLRAADADRQAVADRLRAALDEGRIDFHEYDGRLREAYAAKTYGELDRLIDDLPGTAPIARSALAPAAPPASSSPLSAPTDAPLSDATRRWLIATWDNYFVTVAVCVMIWAIIAATSKDSAGIWPLWVAGPWGAYLAYGTARGLATGEPQRWAAKQERKRARKLAERECCPEVGDGPEGPDAARA